MPASNPEAPVTSHLTPLVPNLAEEFYQQYFRDREGAPSIHSVEWPEPFKALSNYPGPLKQKPSAKSSKK